MSPNIIGFSLLLLGLLLIIGKWLRIKIPLFQRLFLPSSLIAGLLGLIIGPEVIGEITGVDIMPENILFVWRALPSLMINVIFASLFLGTEIPNVKTIWRQAGPQVLLGYATSFGQYFTGLLLAIFVLAPVFGINPMVGALVEMGFVGGHGTAAGMKDTLILMGFPEGADLAIGFATVGIIGGVVIGIILINWGIRKNKLARSFNSLDRSYLERIGIVDQKLRKPAGFITTRAESIDSLSINFGYIAISILIGYGMLRGLIFIEKITWGSATGVYLLKYVPLFPLAMIGGIIFQQIYGKKTKYHTLDKELINRIQGFALDILIVSALATLSLQVIGENIIPFILLSVVGIIWTMFAFLYIAPRILPDFWFERAIGDFGQYLGVTATGLLLMKVADPDKSTPAFESFGYKQILFEPIVGGGIFTAASVPLIYQFGATNIMVFTFILTIIPLILGIILFGRKKRE